MYKLSDEDGRVVDMLLNVDGPGRGSRTKGDGNGHSNGNGHGHANGNGGDGHAHYSPIAVPVSATTAGDGASNGNGYSPAGGAFSAAPSSFSERLVRVGEILDLLQQLPEPDPANDLVKRTLALVDRAPMNAPTATPFVADRPGTTTRPQA